MDYPLPLAQTINMSRGDYLLSLVTSRSTSPSSQRSQPWRSLQVGVTSPHRELSVLQVVGVQLHPVQEVVELRHEGPVREHFSEGVGQPRCWDHYCGLQGVVITSRDFRQDWVIL